MRLRANVAGDLVITGNDLFEERVRVSIAEWQVTAQHCKKNHSAAPQVHLLWKIARLCLYHFGSSITGRATKGRERGVVMVGCAKAKVYEFELPIVIYEYIFRFEVAVCDFVAVEVVDCLNDLLEVSASLILCNSAW